MDDVQINRFNLRVYAIVLKNDSVLIAEENLNGMHITKFPGGGVEYGEGIADALIRELKEEGEIELQEYEHFYTTDFFQRSAFVPTDQLISVYYVCKARVEWNVRETNQSGTGKQHHLKLQFVPLTDLRPEFFTFPVDRYVAGLLME